MAADDVTSQPFPNHSFLGVSTCFVSLIIASIQVLVCSVVCLCRVEPFISSRRSFFYLTLILPRLWRFLFSPVSEWPCLWMFFFFFSLTKLTCTCILPPACSTTARCWFPTWTQKAVGPQGFGGFRWRKKKHLSYNTVFSKVDFFLKICSNFFSFCFRSGLVNKLQQF